MGIYIGILMIIVGTVFVTLGIRELVVRMKNDEKQKSTLPTKLLKSLRAYARGRIGAFEKDDGTYCVIHARYYSDDLNEFDYYKNKAAEKQRFEIVEDDLETAAKAKKICEYYRRVLILRRIREMRYKNSDRIF